MPNLTPPVVDAAMAGRYKRDILAAARAPHDADGALTSFEPLMTCYLTDRTTPADVEAAAAAGVVAFKLYPAGATTNSDSGVTDVAAPSVGAALRAMDAAGLVLCVHGEVTRPEVDVFDREATFVREVLPRVLDHCPTLRQVDVRVAMPRAPRCLRHLTCPASP